MLGRLSGAKYFTSLDLGFWQVPLAKEHREKSAFITPDGLFETRGRGSSSSAPSADAWRRRQRRSRHTGKAARRCAGRGDARASSCAGTAVGKPDTRIVSPICEPGNVTKAVKNVKKRQKGVKTDLKR